MNEILASELFGKRWVERMMVSYHHATLCFIWFVKWCYSFYYKNLMSKDICVSMLSFPFITYKSHKVKLGAIISPPWAPVYTLWILYFIWLWVTDEDLGWFRTTSYVFTPFPQDWGYPCSLGVWCGQGLPRVALRHTNGNTSPSRVKGFLGHRKGK